MRFLHRLGHDGKVLHFVEFALEGHSVLRPGLNQYFNGFVEAWPAFFERDIGGAKEPRMAASQPAFEAPSCEDVCFRDLSSEAHRIFKGKSEQSNSKSDALGELRGGAEKCQWIGGDGKFLEEVMVNHGVNVETDLIGVLDLAENFPGHVRMGFSRRGLHLRVNAESHVRVLAPWFRSLKRNDSFPRWHSRSDK